jgi:hypothetical protein
MEKIGDVGWMGVGSYLTMWDKVRWMRVSKAMSGWARKSLHTGTLALTVDLGDDVAIESRLLRSETPAAVVVRREIAKRLQTLCIMAPKGMDLQPLRGLVSSTATLTSLDVSRVKELANLPVWPLDKLRTLALAPHELGDSGWSLPLPAQWACALPTATHLTSLVCPSLQTSQSSGGITSTMWAIGSEQRRRIQRLVIVGAYSAFITNMGPVGIWTTWWLDGLANYTALETLQLNDLSYENWATSPTPAICKRLVLHPRLKLLVVTNSVLDCRLEADKDKRECVLQTGRAWSTWVVHFCTAVLQEPTWAIDTLRLPQALGLDTDLADLWTHGLSHVRHLALDYVNLGSCIRMRSTPAPSIVSIDLDMRIMEVGVWYSIESPLWDAFPSLTRLVLRGAPPGSNSPAPTLRKERPNINIVESCACLASPMNT